MIIGFGFGSPLVSLLMLVGTSLLSYLLFRVIHRRGRTVDQPTRAQLRQYYFEKRRQARELSSQFDMTDEEIEQKIDETIGPEH